MAIEKYYPKGGGKDSRASANDETRVNRSIGRHFEKKRSKAIQKVKGRKSDKSSYHMPASSHPGKINRWGDEIR